MKIRILAAARQDLLQGYRFYEEQREGIGRYFLDSLYSDIQSLTVTAGIHPVHGAQDPTRPRTASGLNPL